MKFLIPQQNPAQRTEPSQVQEALNISDWSSTGSILFQPPFLKSAAANWFVFSSWCFNTEQSKRQTEQR